MSKGRAEAAAAAPAVDWPLFFLRFLRDGCCAAAAAAKGGTAGAMMDAAQGDIGDVQV